MITVSVRLAISFARSASKAPFSWKQNWDFHPQTRRTSHLIETARYRCEGSADTDRARSNAEPVRFSALFVPVGTQSATMLFQLAKLRDAAIFSATNARSRNTTRGEREEEERRGRKWRRRKRRRVHVSTGRRN